MDSTVEQGVHDLETDLAKMEEPSKDSQDDNLVQRFGNVRKATRDHGRRNRNRGGK